MNYIEKHNQLLKSLGLPVSSSENLSMIQEPPKPKKRELIICMNIDLGDKTENLNVYSDDIIEEKAKWFCNKYDLNEEAVELLVENIKQNIIESENKGGEKEKRKETDEDYSILKNEYDVKKMEELSSKRKLSSK